MKIYSYVTLLLLILPHIANAQSGNTGIGTSLPGSKLTVNGSVGFAYNSTTATTYTMLANDYYVVWNGTANGTITLPGSIAGSGNYKGRLYEIKNTTTGFTLIVAGNGTEKIDDVGGTGVATIAVAPGDGLLLVSNGNTSGTTWEVVSYHSSIPGKKGLFVKSAGTQVINGAATISDWTVVASDFGSAWNGSVFTVPAGMQGWYSISAAFQTDVGGGGSFRTPFQHVQIMVNGVNVATGTASVQVTGGTVNSNAPGSGSALASITYYLNAGDQLSITGNHLTYTVPGNISTTIDADPVRTYLSIFKQ
jgi:hypothetical protein